MVSKLMSRAFSLIGYKRIDDDHVSAPAKITAALADVLTPIGRHAFPPAAPPRAALYQCTAWTKPLAAPARSAGVRLPEKTIVALAPAARRD